MAQVVDAVDVGAGTEDKKDADLTVATRLPNQADVNRCTHIVDRKYSAEEFEKFFAAEKQRLYCLQNMSKGTGRSGGGQHSSPFLRPGPRDHPILIGTTTMMNMTRTTTVSATATMTPLRNPPDARCSSNQKNDRKLC